MGAWLESGYLPGACLDSILIFAFINRRSSQQGFPQIITLIPRILRPALSIRHTLLITIHNNTVDTTWSIMVAHSSLLIYHPSAAFAVQKPTKSNPWIPGPVNESTNLPLSMADFHAGLMAIRPMGRADECFAGARPMWPR